MLRFYLPDTLLVGDTIRLPDDLHHHMVTVCRLKEGEQVILFNGSTDEYVAKLTTVSRKHCEARIEKEQTGLAPSPLHTHLGLGISTGKRFELALQKAVELGVSAITPLITDKSAHGRDSEKKQTHWQRIIISACEQCGRCDIPTCHTPTKLVEWLQQRDEHTKLIASLKETPVPLASLEKPSHLALLIGPASGFSKSEESLACQTGFHCMSLGPRTLRTETACFAALSVLQSRWGDLS